MDLMNRSNRVVVSPTDEEMRSQSQIQPFSGNYSGHHAMHMSQDITHS